MSGFPEYEANSFNTIPVWDIPCISPVREWTTSVIIPDALLWSIII